MFIDRYTGEPRWLNILAIAKGSVLIGATALWMGAAHHTAIKNAADNITHHNQRQVEVGFFEGGAEVSKEFNDYGRIEQYMRNTETDYRYPLGWDMLPLRVADLKRGLENRINHATPEQAREIYPSIVELERSCKRKGYLIRTTEKGYVHPADLDIQIVETETGRLKTYIVLGERTIPTKNLEQRLNQPSEQDKSTNKNTGPWYKIFPGF